MLELRHLRSLQAIEREGSLARAAEALHLTQSALSHQIKALERYYGTPLYLRSTRPLALTAAGQRLLTLAGEVLPAVDAADSTLRRLADGRAGRLHIAIECHACFDWLLPVLDRYRQQWPEVEIDIRPGFGFDAVPALARGDLDLVISSDPREGRELVFEPLFDYEARLALAAGHPLTAREVIEPADLCEETLITYPVERNRLDVFAKFLQPAGAEPRAVRQVELTAIILLLVATRKGVAVLPDWVLAASSQGGFVTRPLGRGGMHGTLHAAIRRSDAEAAWMQAFITDCRAAMECPLR